MKDILLLPFRAIWKLYFFAFFTVTLTLMYPFFYWTLRSERTFPLTFKLMKFWALILQICGGVFLTRKFEADLPKDTSYIICSNHSSYWDIILIYRVFPEYFVFMGKAEIADWPLFNIFFTKGMNILVDRDSNVASHKAFIRMKEELQKGHHAAIFPEGTIPPHAPKLKPFKNGAFKLAVENELPIVPVTFTANWKLLQGGQLFKGYSGPGFTKAIVHAPISTKGMKEEDIVTLRNKVFEIINQPLKDLYESR